MKNFVDNNCEQMFDIIRDLCKIPAPSHMEHARARYCLEWLRGIGAEDAYIDEAQNVILPINCDGSDEITVFAAHTDTVFPDTEPMPYTDDGEYIHSPGVADDTASVAVVMMMAKYYIQNNIMPDSGIMFVLNSCEEGLGNLKGMRQLFADYDKRIKYFISFDSKLNVVHDRCVGSHRYLVEVTTRGGHSYYDFGTPNAIAVVSDIVKEIYAVSVPQTEGTKTTYNVGTISGGTSVNTIAQSASLLCEYRSDNKDCLAYMQQQFESIFEAARCDDVEIKVTTVGTRPCSDVDESKVTELKDIVIPVLEQTIGEKITFTSASTDCNIPMSLGVPSLCAGVCMYDGMHTREEKMQKSTIATGLQAALAMSSAIFDK